MYVEGHCEPKEDVSIETVTCLTEDLLKKIAKILNNKGTSKIDTESTLKELHNDISNEIKKSTDCSNEACWSTYDLIKKGLSIKDFNELISKFRPFLPEIWYKEPNKWLNTDDINNVMYQYEKNFNRFKYTGATPIDFDLKTKENECLVNELCNIDLQEIKDDGILIINLVNIGFLCLWI